MSISKATATTYTTTAGAQFPTLLEAQYREMSDLIVASFYATNNATMVEATRTFAKRCMDWSAQDLNKFRLQVDAIRAANPK